VRVLGCSRGKLSPSLEARGMCHVTLRLLPKLWSLPDACVRSL
jgi:hypothetical protein